MIEVARNNGVAVGICEDTLVLYYARTPTIETVQTIDQASAYAIPKIGQLTALVTIATASRTPSADVRLAMQKTMQRHESTITALAYAILGNGFGNAAARAAVSGMLLWVKPRYPAKVFADVRSAAKWLQSNGATLPPDQRSRHIADIERFCASEATAASGGGALARSRDGYMSVE